MIQHLLTVLISKITVKKVVDEYEKSQKENLYTLQPPKIILWIGLFSVLFWGILSLVALCTAKDVSTIILCGSIFGILLLLGLFLIAYTLNYKVTYKNGLITYRNLLRITKEYSCKDIEKAYYLDQGGIQLIFNTGKKLTFSKEEYYFYNHILNKEHIKAEFKEDDKTVTLKMNELIICILWVPSVILIIGTFQNSGLCLFALCGIAVCTWLQFSNVTYNKDTKLLTVTKCILVKKKYSMLECSAKPIKDESGYITRIDIYKDNKRVGKIPVSAEYKNRAKLIKALCKINA